MKSKFHLEKLPPKYVQPQFYFHVQTRKEVPESRFSDFAVNLSSGAIQKICFRRDIKLFYFVGLF